MVFRGNPSSPLYGTYFTLDHNTYNFWSLKKNGTGTATSTSLGKAPAKMSSFGTDAEGRIYAVAMETGVIYYLDSPDLTPSVSLRSQAGDPAGGYGRTFTASPGGRLEAAVFGFAPVLELFSTGGARLGALRKDEPRLPDNLDAGVYLLRPAASRGSAAGLPDLLVVR